MDRREGRTRFRAILLIMVGSITAMVLMVVYILLYQPTGRISYTTSNHTLTAAAFLSTETEQATATPPLLAVTHIPTPDAVRGAYFTSWAAATPSLRAHMFDVVSSTTLNAVVIDVKDYTGKIAFTIDDPLFIKYKSTVNRIADIKELIGELHAKGIYVIGRVAVFQDPHMVFIKPEWAVHDKRTGALWRDSGGAYWLDPTNRDVWNYAVAIARHAYEVGFDEINFDYVRFPSDGAVSSATYAHLASTTKEQIIKEFFSYLQSELTPLGIPISADIFGQTTSDPGDMGIGQKFENALPYFDAVLPMVYPSHYARGFLGFDKPAAHPYEVIKYAMDKAVARAIAASSSPYIIKPWLQAFDMGATYTPDMIKAQVRATYDTGLTSWILWNAGSVYKKEALVPVERSVATTTIELIRYKMAQKAAEQAYREAASTTAAVPRATSTRP